MSDKWSLDELKLRAQEHTVPPPLLVGSVWESRKKFMQDSISKGYTQQEIATALGVSRQRVHQVMIKMGLNPKEGQQKRTQFKREAQLRPHVRRVLNILKHERIPYKLLVSNRGALIGRSMLRTGADNKLVCIHKATGKVLPYGNHPGYLLLNPCRRDEHKNCDVIVYVVPAGYLIIPSPILESYNVKGAQGVRPAIRTDWRSTHSVTKYQELLEYFNKWDELR